LLLQCIQIQSGICEQREREMTEKWEQGLGFRVQVHHITCRTGTGNIICRYVYSSTSIK
jgi:hypothetical protein